MDGDRFDAWTKTVSAIGTRRAALRAGAGAALAAALVGVGASEVEACKAPGKKCRRHSGKHCCAGTVCHKRHCQCPAGATLCGAICCPHCCDGVACCTGCCDGAACQPGTDDAACGTGGGSCQACPTGETCQSGSCACTKLSCPNHQVCPPPPADPTCQPCSTTTADPNCNVFDPTHTSPAICGQDSSAPGAVCVCLTTPTGAACVGLNGATCFANQSTCTTDGDCNAHFPSGNGVCVTGCSQAVGLECGGNGNACAPRCPGT